ncbi:MAG: tetratricopeptide repeat protein [Bacteroidetes bacterium]|nr:tetratricopeptide repeat protein [Bacteroidota bacterium]
MKKKFVYCLLFAVYCLSSCSNNSKEMDEKQSMIAQIDSINKKMFDGQNMTLDKELASKEISSYEDFVKKFSNDSLSPEYLFRAADLQRALNDNIKAIATLADICKNYPNYKRIPDCIFLQGYYYQEFFNDTISAKIFYMELISKYPNHAFADDAKALMSMFGKSDADIIKSFEKKEKK